MATIQEISQGIEFSLFGDKMEAPDRSFAAVAKARMNICKAEDIRKETELMMKFYANWEKYLMPGPISIAILGELACITVGQGDFSINKSPPLGGFKYIKYPDSFLTCLTQVSHAGWHAFNTAHKNMDQIRLLSISVPSHMKTIVQTLFQDLKAVDALLPGQLNNVKSIADDCTRLAQSVENKFTDVICLIQELLEGCWSSKTQCEEELEETKSFASSKALRRKAAEESMQMASKYYLNRHHLVEDSKSKLHIQLGHFLTIKQSQEMPTTSQNSEMEIGSGIKSAGLKVEQCQEMRKTTLDEYQRSFENLKKQNMELTEILITMQKCKTKEIDFETARKMLIKGLDTLGRVKEQWDKMVHFCQIISNPQIMEFVKSAEDGKRIANSCKSFVIDLFYKQAFNASSVAHLVHMISEIYIEVSSKYLMDCVSSLMRLISMDCSNPSFNVERMKLADGCDEARKAIEDLRVKKNEFESNLRGRVEKISHELNAVLPATCD